MNIYTRGGDKGKTSVIGGRLFKDDKRIESYGTIDELNSFVGLAASYIREDVNFEDIKAILEQIQHELFDCGSDLAFVEKGTRSYKINEEAVTQLELWIDQYEQQCEPITRFILPGGTLLASALHVCRTVCRRAERCTVTFCKDQDESDYNGEVLRYLNRLSDLFFVLSRVSNAREGVGDVEYIRSAEVFR